MIVALGYQARVGKDSTADVLEDRYGYERLSFAHTLKQLALGANPLISPTRSLHEVVVQHGWDEAKTLYPGVRLFLQHLGVACRETLDENVWVNPVLTAIRKPDSDYVITDVRFPNEIIALKELQPEHRVKFVKVVRPGYGGVNGHVSETALQSFGWDFVLHNDGTLGDLAGKVEAMVGMFGHGW
jgi:hypothetical protein